MAKKTEAEKNIERQNLRNVYEPEIAAMKNKKDILKSKIEYLSLQKIDLDNKLQTIGDEYLNFKAVIDQATIKYTDYNDLKGNFMDYVDTETEAIIGHGDICMSNMNLAGMVAETAVSELEKKIKQLQSDLDHLTTEISNTQILFDIVLSRIV
jgi:SMC interacting uncharacterized protein involved in chromosome segregation